jgi:hypothetical protein
MALNEEKCCIRGHFVAWDVCGGDFLGGGCFVSWTFCGVVCFVVGGGEFGR